MNRLFFLFLIGIFLCISCNDTSLLSEETEQKEQNANFQKKVTQIAQSLDWQAVPTSTEERQSSNNDCVDPNVEAGACLEFTKT